MEQLVREEARDQAGLSIAQMCRTLGLSRAEYYRGKCSERRVEAYSSLKCNST
jgi:predicted transcriptional regulator